MMGWARNVSMEEMRNEYRVFGRSLGRPRHRGKDKIRTKLREMG
jgi:hypothetical protein